MKHYCVILGVLFVGLAIAAGCGKKDDKSKKNPNLTADCTKVYKANAKASGDQAKFVAGCKTHLARAKSYIVCVEAAAPKSYCDRGMKDVAIKAELDAMKAALGK